MSSNNEELLLSLMKGLARQRVLDNVDVERGKQDKKWGEQHHPDGTGSAFDKQLAEVFRAECDYKHDNGGMNWRAILLEEVFEAMAEDDLAKLRNELIQSAAVIVNWIEDIDSRD